MKTPVVAAVLTVLTMALNSSIYFADTVLAALSRASEPVGLALWGVALFVVAAGLRKKSAATAPSKPSAEALPNEDQPILTGTTRLHSSVQAITRSGEAVSV